MSSSCKGSSSERAEQYRESVETFDHFADAYQSKYMPGGCYAATYERLDAMVTSNHARVLDIACGPGTIAKFLLDRRPQLSVVGVDLAPRMIALARANCPQAQFWVMSGLEIDGLDTDFDAVVLGFCLPYLDARDAERQIHMAARRLQQHGVFYLSAIEGRYADSGWKTTSDGSRRAFTFYYEEPILRRFVEQAGCTIEHVERQSTNESDGTCTTEIFVFARRV